MDGVVDQAALHVSKVEQSWGQALQMPAADPHDQLPALADLCSTWILIIVTGPLPWHVASPPAPDTKHHLHTPTCSSLHTHRSKIQALANEILAQEAEQPGAGDATATAAASSQPGSSSKALAAIPLMDTHFNSMSSRPARKLAGEWEGARMPAGVMGCRSLCLQLCGTCVVL